MSLVYFWYIITKKLKRKIKLQKKSIKFNEKKEIKCKLVSLKYIHIFIQKNHIRLNVLKQRKWKECAEHLFCSNEKWKLIANKYTNKN